MDVIAASIVRLLALPGTHDAMHVGMTACTMKRASRALALAIVLLATGCATSAEHAKDPSGESTPATTTTTAHIALPSSADAVLEVRPQLRVSVHAPATAPYRSPTLGMGADKVVIRLTNAGADAVSVEGLRAAFSATREGVEFPCREHVEAPAQAREVALLEPGQSVAFERSLDCTMPLPGLYHVRTYVQFGEEDGASRAPRNLAGSFDLALEGTDKRAQPYPSRAGLYAIMTGTALTGPATADLAKSGYKVAIALINAGTQPSRVGSFHFSYLVYREHDPLPCTGESETFAGPPTIAPGHVHTVTSRVACVLATEGHYVVVGKLVIEHDGEGIEIGRLNFEMTRDPTRRDPLLFVPYP
ncbi:MAG: hypothetical protein ABIP39_00100 [Polyangiaceae bacterium]